MNVLHAIIIKLPDIDYSFNTSFLKALAPFGRFEKDQFIFNKSNDYYSPDICLLFDDISTCQVTFKTNVKEITIDINNTTGKFVKSNYTYTPIPLDDYFKRTSNLTFLGIDHVGFDLPWFDKGIHPDINMLRTVLKKTCLYHLFPTGEPWDFIIPSTAAETTNKESIDYNETRRPKFEIVSLDKVSTPFFQFDILVKESYNNLKTLFPEAIHDPSLKNMWVYIQNPFNIDLCFVMNEHSHGDWSHFFKDSRLT